MKIAGVSSIEGLERLSMMQMRDAQKKLFETPFGYSAFRPIIDGIVLKDSPMQAIAEGHAAYVPLLLGTNWDEIRLWSAAYDLPVDKKPLAILDKQLRNIFDTSAHQAIETKRKADTDYADECVHL